MTTGIEGDAGAQPQRTMLSWHRTVLAVTMGALVASMTAQRLGHPVLSGLAALAAIAGLGGALRRLRYWQPTAASRWSVLLQVTVAVVVLGALGVALAVANILDTLGA
ncbi:MAG TPA: hypothetical protein H9815_02115 [Candidatus Ruania gallistercoris]|uniref:DUF202 domain-containing protein n=1 Tax=Candidatus Ruania gallistercoris TaxID=2838746 RepID=A0A9D2EC08_9MICO|nr:hypothetical protein [Candidatus Ruania gallistercoris]